MTTKTPTDSTLRNLLKREAAAVTRKTRESVTNRLDGMVRMVEAEQGAEAAEALRVRIETLRVWVRTGEAAAPTVRRTEIDKALDAIARRDAEPETPATLGLSRVLAACELVHAAIRRQHADVPVVAMTIGTGSDTRKGLTKWGHHAPLRWARKDAAGERVAEIMVSGEGLGRDAEEVLVTLIHEAAHALCLARGVKDTSRQNRYHNKAFAAAARELGLVPSGQPDAKHGYSFCTLGEAARSRYAGELAALAAVLTVSRTAEARPTRDGDEDKKAEQRVKAECECGRSFRIAMSILKQAAIVCDACGSRFRADGDDDDLDDE